MSAAKATGLQVESTKPLSRAERRAAAARVHSEQEDETAPTSDIAPAATPETIGRSPHQSAPPPVAAPAEPPASPADAPPGVALRLREKPGKRPFATQLRPSTLARLEWVKARGYVITDTVDDAINQYLDAADIPPAR